MHNLGIWRIFIWEDGKNPFGNLAHFCLESWRLQAMEYFSICYKSSNKSSLHNRVRLLAAGIAAMLGR